MTDAEKRRAKIDAIAKIMDPDVFRPLSGHNPGQCEECDSLREMARQRARATLRVIARIEREPPSKAKE